MKALFIFLVAAEDRPARWQDARLRPGALFLVGDPKQAIYRFRGADITAYNEARASIAAQDGGAVVEITANFLRTTIVYSNGQQAIVRRKRTDARRNDISLR